VFKDKAVVICITPVRNEAWILDRFLKCASLWADYIVIADRMSTDGSREIVKKYPKVKLLDNTSDDFDEKTRITLMVNEARKIPGKRLIIALDADEALSANFAESPEWDKMLNAPEGTVFKFEWVNILPDMKHCWLEGNRFFGVVDDGYEGKYIKIHGPRLPIRNNASVVSLEGIKVLHYQYTDWERMKSKQRWYQIWASLRFPNQRPVDIYRLYHPVERVARERIIPLRKEWFSYYESKGIDMKEVKKDLSYQRNKNKEVLAFFEKYGVKRFRKCDVWDVDWEEISREIRYEINGPLKDPRNFFDKAIHAWLARTQMNPWSLKNKIISRALELFGW